jgi:hypothetical protein
MSNGYLSLERPGESVFDGLPLTRKDLRHLLELAGLYGWADHEAARELLFAGDGVSDDTGALSDQMARRLGRVLEQALDDLPNHDARGHKLRPARWAGPDAAKNGWLEEDPAHPLSPLERFSGAEKEWVREVAMFCRRGAFRVVWEWW